MNWLTRAINFGEKIKKVLRKRPSKEDIANSDWTSCCKGPTLKKDLENGDPSIFLGDGGYGADMNISMVNVRDGEEKIIAAS